MTNNVRNRMHDDIDGTPREIKPARAVVKPSLQKKNPARGGVLVSIEP